MAAGCSASLLNITVFLSVSAGFEGCSMVPSIYPLETLHNSLSLKQVDEFLNKVCESSSEAHAKTMKGDSLYFRSNVGIDVSIILNLWPRGWGSHLPIRSP